MQRRNIRRINDKSFGIKLGSFLLPSKPSTSTPARQDDLLFSTADGFTGIIQQPKLRQAHKDYTTRVSTRVNAVNGRKYFGDLTIFSWMLVEEFVSAPFNYPDGFPLHHSDKVFC